MDARKAAGSPELEPLEWDAPIVDIALARRQVGVARAATPMLDVRPAPGILDRYIAARFPGYFRVAADLDDAAKLIDAARLYFDERKTDRAIELLDLAILRDPTSEQLQLARLEIVFLVRDGELYAQYARDFRRRYPDSREWIEICRLGRAVAPEEGLFGAKQGQRAYDHYGPWPHTPNWIQAPWDLTSEVLAADYHRAMAGESGPDIAHALQYAA